MDIRRSIRAIALITVMGCLHIRCHSEHSLPLPTVPNPPNALAPGSLQRNFDIPPMPRFAPTVEQKHTKHPNHRPKLSPSAQPSTTKHPVVSTKSNPSPKTPTPRTLSPTIPKPRTASSGKEVGLLQAPTPVEHTPVESVQIAKLKTTPPQPKTPRDQRWAKQVAQFYGEGRQFLLLIQTDKPLYQPGETIWVRAVGLKRKGNLTHSLPERATYQLKNPKQQVIRTATVPVYAGHSQYSFVLSRHQVGGEYSITIQYHQTQARSTHKITVQTYQTPRMQKKLVFLRKGYGAGDTVYATLSLKRATGEPLRQHPFWVSARLAGKEYRRWKQTSSSQGDSLISFPLPKNLDTDDGLLVIQVAYAGASESIARAIPLRTRHLRLGFFPEGGTTAQGLPNRVYFACRRKLDEKPQDIEGTIVDDQNQIVTRYRSFHDGMGRFLYTPQPGRRYSLHIHKPIGITETFALPPAKPHNISMQTVDDFSSKHQEIRLLVHSQTTHTVVLSAMQYETVIGHARFQLRKGPQQLTLPLQQQWRGIIRLTLFDAQYRRPLLERLIFRHRGKGLRFEFITAKTRYRPQDTVHLKIRVKTPHGTPLPNATLGVAVVDQTTLAYADDHEPHILAQRYLSGQLVGKIHKPNFYFDRKETKAARGLDLIMGTHGWRDFDWKQIQRGTKPPSIPNLWASNSTRPLSSMRWLQTIQRFPTVISSTTPDIADKQDPADQIASANKPATPSPKQEKTQDTTEPSPNTSDRRGNPIGMKFWYGEDTPAKTSKAKRQSSRVRQKKAPSASTESESRRPPTTSNPRPLQDPAPRKTRRSRRNRGLLGSTSGGGKTASIGQGFGGYGGIGTKGKGSGGGGLGRASNKPLSPLSRRNRGLRLPGNLYPLGGLGRGKGSVLGTGTYYRRLDNFRIGGGRVGKYVGGYRPFYGSSQRVYSGSPRVYGALNRFVIQRVIRQRSRQFRYAYQRGLQRNPSLQGKLTVRIAINARGRVSSASVARSELRDPLFQRQILSIVRRMRFPAPTGGGMVFVMYPLIFRNHRAYGQSYRRYPPYIAWSYPRSFPVFFYQKVHSSAQIQRKDFRDTIFWHPHLKTDAWGEVNVSFGLNDSITSFRVQTTGLGQGYLDQAHHTIRSTRPFHLTVRTPIAVSSGDAMVLPVTLDNDTSQPMRIRMTSRMSRHFRLEEDPLPNAVQLAAKQSKTYYYPIRVVARHGSGTVHITVQGLGFSDAIERKILIQERGYPRSTGWSGTLLPQQTLSKTVILPKKFSHLRGQWMIETNPVRSWEQSLQSMLREPYGCFEQTSSVNYPNILILRYLTSRNIQNPALFRRSYGILDRGYKRLLNYESKGGGFEWFGGSPAHEALTAYGLLQFLAMKKVYPHVDSAMIQRTKAWLLGRRNGEGGYHQSTRSRFGFQASQTINDLYITYALTAAGSRDLHKEVHYAAQQALDSNDPYLLALALLAHHRVRPKQPLTRQLHRSLLKQQQSDGSFRSRGSSITRSYGINLQFETTALATLAMLKTDTPHQQIRRSIQWMREHRDPYGGFGTTQATVLVLQALTTWEERYPPLTGVGTFRLWLNDHLVQTSKVSATQPLSLPPTWIRGLQPGKNTLRIQWQGQRAVPFGLGLHYRTYQPVTDKHAPVSIHTALQQDRVRIGNVVRLNVTLQNNTQRALPMVLAKIAIPGTLQWSSWQLKQWKEQGVIAFYETTPREWIVYLRSMQPGAIKKLHLDLEALVTGHYTSPSSSAYLYYSPEQKHWDAPLSLLVRP